jgi:sn-glycerol 3-phosphate transport system ATP-binding protein
MDEPLSNLDAQLRVEMRREIRALQQKLGMTMVYVTHDQTEAMTMADQVVLLKGGRIEQDAPPADLYARPATAFAARFIGTPPMNVLRLAGPPDHLIGVRPEDMRFADAGLPVRVTSVEFLGADSIVTCAAGAESLAVRLAGRVALAEGKSAHVTWTPEAAHLFDPDTGKRVGTGRTIR